MREGPMTDAMMVAAADGADAAVKHDVTLYMQPEAARCLPRRPSYLMTRCTDVPRATACPNMSWWGFFGRTSDAQQSCFTHYWCIAMCWTSPYCPYTVPHGRVYIYIQTDITLHCIALHCIALHYITLHYKIHT